MSGESEAPAMKTGAMSGAAVGLRHQVMVSTYHKSDELSICDASSSMMMLLALEKLATVGAQKTGVYVAAQIVLNCQAWVCNGR
jgi:hypothetical protein